MVLNEQQSNAVQKLHRFVTDPYSNFISLEGFAGTGKTFAIQHFIKRLSKKTRVAVTAPTNKAVSVLKGFGSAIGLHIPAKTIYSSLGLVLSSNNEIRQCTQGTDGDFNDFDIIVVDECSMLNRRLTDIITQRTEPTQKLIFMGDPYQLNPVHELISPSFTLGQTLRLTQVMRQEEGPLLELIAQVRQQCIDGTRPDPACTRTNEAGDGVHVMFGSEFIDVAAYQFTTAEYQSDPSFARYIAWTNNEVKRFNRLVRHRMFGDGAPLYLAGEYVTLLSPVFDESDNLLFFVDDEVKITHAEEGVFTDWLESDKAKYKVWRLTLEARDGRTGTVVTMHNQSIAKYTRRCQELAKQCREGRRPWQMFWQFKELFTEVRHLYATTAHRAQGQTIENVFVNVNDMMKNQRDDELKRLLYVGLSRASQNVVLNSNLLAV